jgi:hypothetical protein
MLKMENLSLSHFKPKIIYHCPGCGAELHCPCKHCRKSNKGKSMWLWLKDGERCMCACCGFTAHADWWQDEEVWQFDHPYRSFIRRLFLIAKIHYSGVTKI